MKKLNIKDIPEGFPATAIWRGKSNAKNDSIFGALAMQIPGKIGILEMIIGDDFVDYYDQSEQIDPATISQCTGEHDDEGVLIFGDDIVDWLYYNDVTEIPYWYKCVVRRERDGSFWAYPIDKKTRVRYSLWDKTAIKVVGNIHETMV